MIMGLTISGSVIGALAGITAVIMGQSLWTGVAIYAATGLLTVLILCLAIAVAAYLNRNSRKEEVTLAKARKRP